MKLTVGIATQNRLDALIRCVRSIAVISDLVNEIIVVDDCSDNPIEGPLREALGSDFPLPLRVITQVKNYGPITERNLIAELASDDLLLSLDDDTVILEPQGIRSAIQIMLNDGRIGAVAFAQADWAGDPLPAFMQPAPVAYRCYTPSFIGYATLLRRQAFMDLGGYRSRFFRTGEEKEYCLRLLDRHYYVVYLPDAKVAHLLDLAGRRTNETYIRHVIRNDCLGAIYNQPLPLMLWSLLTRFRAYKSMVRSAKVEEGEGFKGLVSDLRAALPDVWRERRPLQWRTFWRWQKIKKQLPAYEPSGRAV
jgi:GT2 family glycosyltransferase